MRLLIRSTSILGVGLMLSGLGVLAYVSLKTDETETPRYVSEVSSISVTPTPVPTLEPTPEPTPASTAPVARIQIADISLDAPVVTLGVDPDGTMQIPKGPKEVAWYTFSARPGYKGNVVMAGHVDYVNYGPAVFWSLRQLKEGEEIVVTLADGSTFNYRIVSVTAYDEATAPVQEIVGPTTNESITLITCTGTFSRASHDYDKRLVVRGERVS
jgi:LPXTG-site transpeptidase (sortase) family protein